MEMSGEQRGGLALAVIEDFYHGTYKLNPLCGYIQPAMHMGVLYRGCVCGCVRWVGFMISSVICTEPAREVESPDFEAHYYPHYDYYDDDDDTNTFDDQTQVGEDTVHV